MRVVCLVGVWWGGEARRQLLDERERALQVAYQSTNNRLVRLVAVEDALRPMAAHLAHVQRETQRVDAQLAALNAD